MENQTVYFFRENESEFVKIGMTTQEDIYGRFASFKTYAPKGCYIVGIIKTNNASLLEKNIHEKYNSFRVNGEFFKIDDNTCKHIIDIHSSDKQKEITDLFYYWLSSPNSNIQQLKKIINNSIVIEKTPDDGFKAALLELFDNENRDTYLNFSEICKVVLSTYPSIRINIKVHGAICRAFFGGRVSKNRDGKSTYCYYLSLKKL